MLLNDKVAIITGGGSGLGEAACKLFAEHGAKVVVADYNFENAKRVSDEINQQHGTDIAIQTPNDDIKAREFRAIPIWVNVANRSQVDGMVEDVLHSFGKIDILVNNAGITMDSTLAKMKQEQWDQVIAVNQTGVFNCTQAAVPHMIEQKSGRIINTSSIVGRFGNFGQTNYAASKAAVIAMTQTWAKELGRKGITVNAVAPGFIRTPMTAAMPPEVLDKMAKMVPVQRLGAPEDIANTYLFLASDMGKYVNGAVIAVDGGLVI
jgi:3-oxoacyl-[acyl-carrier protein] reductase